ncbi:MAG TPA: LytR family transcriptional regulator [bacterium (Candidatus Stahlbacteria)]|nr:LytR family transcriptional regulator [Candidatus Stahlbacteria bacterium]
MGRINLPLLILTILVIIFGISFYRHFEKEGVKSDIFENAQLRVEVLNGCGVNDLAMIVSDRLRRMGFDVVEIGDAENYDFEKTVIIDRTDDNMRNARRLGRVIGCSHLGKDIDSSLYIDVTILLGKDYLDYFPEVRKKPKWMR